jgi:NAD(P)H-nitrite reductase large subunit
MKILIIGAGPAGVTVAETIRELDRNVELEMFSLEPYPPYSPPAMADHFIHGSHAHLWRGMNWPERNEINYHSGAKITAVDPDGHKVVLDNGSNVDYQRLVIASGSRLYAPLPGADLPGVYNFKSLSAAESLVAKVKDQSASSAVIVGAGFIGMEIALLLRELNVDVTQIEMLDQVMAAMLDADTASIALNLMRNRGINIRLDTKATAFVGNGKAEGIQLDSGEILHADLLIAATGIKPNLEFIQNTNLEYDWGLRVDDHLQTTATDIFAAGDVVETPDRLTGEISVRAILPNAIEQGRVVGYNLMGFERLYQGAERMNSLKHLGLPIMAAGLKEGDEILQTRRNGNLQTIYLQENRLVGFQLVGDIRSAGIMHALMNRGESVLPIKDKLLKPEFGLGSIIWNAITPYT